MIPTKKAGLFLFLLGFALYAQTSNYPIQVVSLGVQDRRGQFVEDVERTQIVVEGVAASVQRAELDNAPRRILLLLDTSGSMGDYKSLSWSNVAKFATRFALLRRGEDSIGLDTFATFTASGKNLARPRLHDMTPPQGPILK